MNMVAWIDSINEIADQFDVLVLDQWGVLHNGSEPYPGAVETLVHLKQEGNRLAVLSNSGKRAEPNARRIAAMGFHPAFFDCVMTSGEALWRDIARNTVPESRFMPIERAKGDATRWAEGLDITLTWTLAEAEALLLMGLPDEHKPDDWQSVLDEALGRGVTVYCSNPDMASPRAGGRTVISPGTLARDYESCGGSVQFYGKPHPPIFHSLQSELNTVPDRILMIGDSLEHDIAGAVAAGWSSLLVRDGLHRNEFTGGNGAKVLDALARSQDAPLPGFTIRSLE